MKIAFFGTPSHSAKLLKSLIDENFQIEFVVTNPDKPSGRGKNLHPTPVKEVAISNNIPVYQFPSIKTDEAISQITAKPIDIFFVFAYGSIIPPKIFNHPKSGTINLHGSLLPEFRGASPIQSAILAGKTITGMTLQYIVEELDAGDIIVQTEIPIDEKDNFETLLEKMTISGTEEILKLLKNYKGEKFSSTPQDSSKATICRKIKPESRKLDFQENARDLFNKIRAYYPGNTCYAEFRGKRIKIISSRVEELTIDGETGAISFLDKKNWGVICGDRKILVLESLQPENKKVMSHLDFRNGMRLENGELFR
ncbi:MAG: methionyl-tRNA formyltransferase [Leptospiraceae bacterium]|nr:methionyl-tRNA formyltransferase [Leptospiraceae bacterium]